MIKISFHLELKADSSDILKLVASRVSSSLGVVNEQFAKVIRK